MGFTIIIIITIPLNRVMDGTRHPMALGVEWKSINIWAMMVRSITPSFSPFFFFFSLYNAAQHTDDWSSVFGGVEARMFSHPQLSPCSWEDVETPLADDGHSLRISFRHRLRHPRCCITVVSYFLSGTDFSPDSKAHVRSLGLH